MGGKENAMIFRHSGIPTFSGAAPAALGKSFHQQ
jgi:hypothetical protein